MDKKQLEQLSGFYGCLYLCWGNLPSLDPKCYSWQRNRIGIEIGFSFTLERFQLTCFFVSRTGGKYKSGAQTAKEKKLSDEYQKLHIHTSHLLSVDSRWSARVQKNLLPAEFLQCFNSMLLHSHRASYRFSIKKKKSLNK